MELGVLLQEEVEGREATEHVLGEVGAVHPQDQVLAAAAQDLALVLVHLGALGVALEARSRDRQRIGPDPDVATLEADHAAVLVHVEVEQLAAAEEEVALVGAGVEGDDVVGEDPLVDVLADVAGQHAPGVGLGPGNVDEVVQEEVRPLLADVLGRQVEVVVVQHHHGLFAARRLLEHGLGEVFVHHAVALVVGLHLVAADVRRVREVPEVVLDEPEHRVGHDVVEAVVGLGIALDEADPVLHAVELHLEAAAVVFAARLDVLLGHGRGDPDRLAVLHEALQGGDEPAAAAASGQPAPVLPFEGGGAAVRDEYERSAHARALKIRSQSRRSRGVRKWRRTCSLPERPSVRPSSGSRRIETARSAHSSGEETR